jgi:hypothetical protein
LEFKTFDRKLIDQSLIEPLGSQDRWDRTDKGDQAGKSKQSPG